MNIDRSLVLNRYLHGLFGAERFDDLRRGLKEQEEGAGPGGPSRFFHVLSGRSGIKIGERTLEDYDRRVIEYEATLAKKRRAEPFRSFKYFQYLALLYTEVFLDRLTDDPTGFGRKPIVIVAHSMGGVISRYLLRLSQLSGPNAGHATADRVLRLITLGTPHHGSPMANGPAVADKAGIR